MGVRGARRVDRQSRMFGAMTLRATRACLPTSGRGEFPHRNTEADGFVRTAPVRSFKANGFGLFDMGGNVWEWCADAYGRDAYARRAGSKVISNPLVERSADPRNPRTTSRAQRGGSFLCNDKYCSRYRPSARHGLSPDTGMSHVGFRCVKSP